MNKDAKIYLAGHTGLLGRALLAKLKAQGYTNILTVTHSEVDLTRQAEVESLFEKEHIRYVILAAARVGGIHANMTYPAQFIYDNITIQTNVMHCAYLSKVEKLLFFGSACSYPKQCAQPIVEESLLTGPPEPTNEAYALAKLAGITMVKSYRRQYKANFLCAIPTNLYGPGDHFDIENSHVIPALIRRFHEAKINNMPDITIWGSGTPRREFLYVDDAADACLFLMNHYTGQDPVNISAGTDISIADLACLIQRITGYTGKILFDRSKPDGMERKMLEGSKLANAGWRAGTSLQEGIEKTYTWYLARQEHP